MLQTCANVVNNVTKCLFGSSNNKRGTQLNKQRNDFEKKEAIIKMKKANTLEMKKLYIVEDDHS